MIFCSPNKFDFWEVSPRKREIERKTDRQINIQTKIQTSNVMLQIENCSLIEIGLDTQFFRQAQFLGSIIMKQKLIERERQRERETETNRQTDRQFYKGKSHFTD